MKKLFAACFFSLTATLLAAQPAIQWQKTYGGSQDDYATSMQATTDGGYVMVGNCNSSDGDVVGHHGYVDWWVVKADHTGAIQWKRALGGSYWETEPQIQQVSDGGYIIVGNSESDDGDVLGNHGGFDLWIVKLSADGTISWQRSLGGSSGDGAAALIQTSDGGYIVAGSTNSTNYDAVGNHGKYDFLIVKLSANGTTEWIKVLGGSQFDYPSKIIQSKDNGYLLAGVTYSNDGNVTGYHAGVDFWILKLTSTGDLEWEQALGGSGDETPTDVIQSNDGGYVIVGKSFSTDGDVLGNHGGDDYWVVKLSGTGGLQWQKSYGGSDFDGARSIQKAEDDGFLISGISMSNDGDVTGSHYAGFWSSDHWIIRIDKDGALLWEKALGGTGEDTHHYVKILPDGGYLLVGESDSSDGDVPGNYGCTDVWAMRLSNTGAEIWKKILGGSGFDEGYFVESTSDGGYILGARSSSYNIDVKGQHGLGDYWLVKLFPDKVGTEELDYSSQPNYMEIFPNPSTGQVFIQLSVEAATMEVHVYNLLGQALHQQRISNGGALDISKLPKGIYSVQAVTPSGKVFSSKIVLED